MLLTRGANTYPNDANGNTLTRGGRTNTCDSANRLVQCVNGSTTSTFTYAAAEVGGMTILERAEVQASRVTMVFSAVVLCALYDLEVIGALIASDYAMQNGE